MITQRWSHTSTTSQPPRFPRCRLAMATAGTSGGCGGLLAGLRVGEAVGVDAGLDDVGGLGSRCARAAEAAVRFCGSRRLRPRQPTGAGSAMRRGRTRSIRRTRPASWPRRCRARRTGPAPHRERREEPPRRHRVSLVGRNQQQVQKTCGQPISLIAHEPPDSPLPAGTAFPTSLRGAHASQKLSRNPRFDSSTAAADCCLGRFLIVSAAS